VVDEIVGAVINRLECTLEMSLTLGPRPSPIPMGPSDSLPQAPLLFCSITVNAIVCYFLRSNYIFKWDLLCVKNILLRVGTLGFSVSRVLYHSFPQSSE